MPEFLNRVLPRSGAWATVRHARWPRPWQGGVWLMGLMSVSVWAQPVPGNTGMLTEATRTESSRPAPTAAAPDSPIRLRSTSRLNEKISDEQRRALPTFLYGDLLTGRPDLDMLITGSVLLRRGDTTIRADKLDYYQPDDLAKAQGHVRINRAGNVFEGPAMELKVDAFEGFFTQPSYQFLSNNAHGQATRVDFIDDKRAVIRNATFTTCERKPGPSWMPEWMMRAVTLRIDGEDEVGVAEDAQLSFQGVPFLNISSLGFSMSEKRKSGALAPTFGVDSISGTQVTAPYYFDIAPNRDLTLYPTLMSKRGLDLGAEFRYLEPTYNGKFRANYMPGDLLSGTDRWGGSYQHLGTIATGIDGVGNLGLNLNLNRVSDDNYWRDFPRAGTSLTQRLLPSDALLTWARGDYSATLRTLKWQTLQDPTSPIVPPYDRLPQLAGRFGKLDVNGFDMSVDGDYTQFYSDRTLTGQTNGQRSFMLAQLSRPMVSAFGFVTPKVQLHTTSYQFDMPISTGDMTASRSVPTFSLDSGLVFERSANYFGRDLTQTLEPRAYYTYTPYRNQSYLPNYDSGLSDFNFASIYTDNAFVGHDRISDNNLLTTGVTTRFLDPRTGAEQVRLAVAQRFRLEDQRVTLPNGAYSPSGISDILLGAGVNLDNRWVLDSLVQYNPTTQQSVRSTVGARYHPGNYRVVNMAYRFQRDTSELVDVGWQWPLSAPWSAEPPDAGGSGRGLGADRWYSVGRMNYSLAEAKLVDSIVGFEYDAGCWLGRVVVEKLSTGLVTSNQRLMFQLEFVGFSRLGIDPLSTLKTNIPRYQTLRETTSAPSRFSNYD